MLALITFSVCLLWVTVEGCMRTTPTDDGALSCSRTLQLTTCPYQSGCSTCLATTVDYSTAGGRLTAQVTCGTTTATQYVRLNRADGSFPIEVDRSALGVIRCSANGWIYSHQGSDVVVNGVTCYHFANSVQMSPIDIEAADVTYDPSLDPSKLNFNYAIGDVHEMDLAPDSHGFVLHTSEDVNAIQSSLTATHLDGTYKLYNVHAHWSYPARGPMMGSEHLLNGMAFPAEIHLVHFNPKYVTFTNAVGKPDGIAVLGVFVQIGAANPEFGKITSAIQKHSPVTEEVEVPGSDLQNIDVNQLLPVDRNYFTYTGSLTTPQYNTCVIWTVFRNPITVSQEQYNILLDLFSDQNVRPTQDIMSIIRSSFQP